MDDLFRDDDSNAASSPNAAAQRVARMRNMRDLGLRLLDTARHDGPDDLARLLSIGVSAGFIDPLRGTALHQAAVAGNRDNVEMLLQAHAEPPTPTSPSLRLSCRGMPTPLHLAVWNNHIEIVNTLLHQSISVDAADRRGLTPLHIAAHLNSMASVRLLLQAGANVDALDCEGRSPLHFACANASVGAAELLLLQAPHTLQLRDNDGNGCMEYAAVSRDANELLKPHPMESYNSAHWTNIPTTAMTVNDSTAVTRVLMEHGAAVTPQSLQYALNALNPTFLEVALPPVQCRTGGIEWDIDVRRLLDIYTKLVADSTKIRTPTQMKMDFKEVARLLAPLLVEHFSSADLIAAARDSSDATLCNEEGLSLLQEVLRHHTWERRQAALLLRRELVGVETESKASTLTHDVGAP